MFCCFFQIANVDIFMRFVAKTRLARTEDDDRRPERNKTGTIRGITDGFAFFGSDHLAKRLDEITMEIGL